VIVKESGKGLSIPETFGAPPSSQPASPPEFQSRVKVEGGPAGTGGGKAAPRVVNGLGVLTIISGALAASNHTYVETADVIFQDEKGYFTVGRMQAFGIGFGTPKKQYVVLENPSNPRTRVAPVGPPIEISVEQLDSYKAESDAVNGTYEWNAEGSWDPRDWGPKHFEPGLLKKDTSAPFCVGDVPIEDQMPCSI